MTLPVLFQAQPPTAIRAERVTTTILAHGPSALPEPISKSDDLQDLDLRSVFSGGIGFHLIKRERTTLDLLSGLNYTRESYSTIQRNLIALTLGEEFMKKIGASTVLTQKLYAYPDINEGGQYRTTFNFATVTKLSKWLGWQNSFADTYVTNPPLGARQNDIILTTGLNIAFTR